MKTVGLLCKVLFVFFSILLMISCGGGGGGGSSDKLDKDFEINDHGYPVVSGYYSSRSTPFSYNCHGESGTTTPLIENVEITQDINRLSFSSDSPDAPTMGNIVEDSGTSGYIERNGSFATVRRFTVENFPKVPGKLYYALHGDGKFTSTGWSGHMHIRVTLEYDLSSCDYYGSFYGDKIISKIAYQKKSELSSEAAPHPDIWRLDSIFCQIINDLSFF